MNVKLGAKQVELFWEKVEKTDNCWSWTAATDKDGYGVWSVRLQGKPKQFRAHRLSYYLAGNDLDEKLTIDHLCKNKACLRPSHLEQVSIRENIKRSSSFNGLKTRCKNGHPFSDDNTYVYNSRKRNCRKCHAASEMARYYARKAQ